MARWLSASLLVTCSGFAAGQQSPRVLEFKEPRPTHYTLLPAPPARGPISAAASGSPWSQALAGHSTNVVELGSRVVLQVEAGVPILPLLTFHNLRLAREVKPGLLILQAPDSLAALEAAEALARENGVTASYPIMRRPMERRDSFAPPPNDPLFPELWHLDNRDSSLTLAWGRSGRSRRLALHAGREYSGGDRG